jgi:hypothetical protein
MSNRKLPQVPTTEEVSGKRNDESDIETSPKTPHKSIGLQENNFLENKSDDINSNSSREEIIGLNVSQKLYNVPKSEYELETSPTDEKKQLIPEIYSNQQIMSNQRKEFDTDSLSNTPKSRIVTSPPILPSSSTPPPSPLSPQPTPFASTVKYSIEHQQRSRSEPQISISTSPTLQEQKKINVKDDLQNKGFLQSLLDNSSINDSIKENIDKHASFRQDHLSQSPSSSDNKSKNLRNNHVSVSIGTIMIKISNSDKENERPIQINSRKSEKGNTTSLRRYYVKLR